MRIRGTKPEFWRSERIASVSWDARFVLKGLESYVDDNGVGKDDLALIVGDLFQRDLVREPSRTLARVSEAISELNSGGLLHRYEVDGTKLLYIAFWEQVQRIDKPSPGRFPRPDGTWNFKDSEIRESSANPRESSRILAPGTEEQGNRGTEEQARPGKPDRFDEFYQAYPRRVDRGHAEKAWKSAIKNTEPEVIIEAASSFAERSRGAEAKFIAHPATWLNGKRWLDETDDLEPANSGSWFPGA